MEELSRVLAKAERYVRDCAVLVAEQRIRVSQCLINGWDTCESRRVLAEMEMNYNLIVRERDRLKAQRAGIDELQRVRREGEAVN